MQPKAVESAPSNSGLSSFGIRIPFFVSGGLGAFGLIFSFLVLRESNPKILENAKQTDQVQQKDDDALDVGIALDTALDNSSVGDDTENLEVSKARAGAIAAHLVNRGISKERLNAEGYGEHRVLNKCKNDVNCSEKQHNVNERVEIAIF